MAVHVRSRCASGAEDDRVLVVVRHCARSVMGEADSAVEWIDPLGCSTIPSSQAAVVVQTAVQLAIGEAIVVHQERQRVTALALPRPPLHFVSSSDTFGKGRKAVEPWYLRYLILKVLLALWTPQVVYQSSDDQ